MSHINTPFDRLSIDQQGLVLGIAASFEQAWKNANAAQSEPPTINVFLRQIGQNADNSLMEQAGLFQLLMLDLEYRADRNAPISLEEYLRLFPSHGFLIDHCFRAFGAHRHNVEIVRPLAEGGSSVISIARDHTLDRTVAHKVLKEHYTFDAGRQARFRREAEVTARLQHPGIVSIYSLNCSDEGLISYTMPLIDGEQLATAINRFHNDAESARNIAAYQAGLRKLLRRFVDACQAIAYAHSQGYVHRDIKPQNIMLGKFGETILVDWGLAKCFAQPEVQTDATETESARPENSDVLSVTQTGDIFGTPMFMSPEQARGDMTNVGPASDIYSLGVTLYSLLTGHLPFQSNDTGALLAEVVKGVFRSPGEVCRAVPPALDAICLKCMALESSSRYPSAQALAADIENWLANDPVSAHSEPLPQRVARWTRRHPTLTGITVVASALVTIGLSAVTFLSTTHNRQLSDAKAGIEQSYDLLESMFEEVDPSFRNESDQNSLSQRLRERIQAVAKDLNTKSIKDPVARSKVETSFGTILTALGDPEQAIPLLSNAVQCRSRILGPRDWATLHSRLRLAYALSRAGHAKEALGQFEELARIAPDALRDDRSMLLDVTMHHARQLAELGRFDEARTLIERSLKTEPYCSNEEDRYSLIYTLAGILLHSSEPTEHVIALYREVFDYRTRNFGPDHAWTLNAMHDLANALSIASEWKQSSDLYSECSARRRSLLGDFHPSTISAATNGAYAMSQTGRIAEAKAILQQLKQQVILHRGAESKEGVDVQSMLTSIQAESGEYATAILPAMENLDVARRIWRSDAPQFLDVLLRLVSLQCSANKFDECKPLALECLEWHSKTLGRSNDQTASAMYYAGNCFLHTGEPDKAVKVLEECFEFRRAKLGASADGTLNAMNALAVAYKKCNQPDRAVDIAEQAYRISTNGLGENHPNTMMSAANLASFQAEAGNLNAALDTTQRCWESSVNLNGSDHPTTLLLLNNLASIHEDLGQFELAAARFQECSDEYEAKYGADHPHRMDCEEGLMRVWHKQRNYERATSICNQLIDQQRAAVQPDPKRFSRLLQELGEMQREQNQAFDAEKSLRECLEIRKSAMPEDWRLFCTQGWLGTVLCDMKKFEEAEQLMLTGYEGLLTNESAIPSKQTHRIQEAVHHIAEMYEKWGKPEQALQWKSRLIDPRSDGE